MKNDDTTQSIFRGAKHFLSGTLISRLSGLLRDIAMAYAFGTHASVAAFMVALRFSLLFRRLLGEGCMQSAFVPQFESIRKENGSSAFQFFLDLKALTTLALLFIIGITTTSLFCISHFGNLSSGNQEIVFNTLIMMPALLFICLYGINSSLLQCQNQYFLSAIAPVAFNIVWSIAAYGLWGKDPTSAMPWLSSFIVIAACAQWLITEPSTLKLLFSQLGNFHKWRVHLKSPHLLSLLGPLFLGMIGVTSTQINSAVDVVFARYAESDGPAFLWYAIRLAQLPLALFGVALSSALLPPLSRASKAQDLKHFLHFLKDALFKCSSLMVPVTCALFILGPQIIHLLFARGDFGKDALFGTTKCLLGYTVGLLPMALVLIIAPALYAQNRFRSTTIASTASMGINVLLNGLFTLVLGWGAESVAFATSIAAFFNYFLLSYFLKKSLDFKEQLLLTKEFFQISTLSFVSTLLSLFVEYAVLGSIFVVSVMQGRGELLSLFELSKHLLLPGFTFILSWACLCSLSGFDPTFGLFGRKEEREKTVHEN